MVNYVKRIISLAYVIQLIAFTKAKEFVIKSKRLNGQRFFSKQPTWFFLLFLKENVFFCFFKSNKILFFCNENGNTSF